MKQLIEKYLPKETHEYGEMIVLSVAFLVLFVLGSLFPKFIFEYGQLSSPFEISKLWTIFSYAFLHKGFFHILGNIFLLFFGFRLLKEFLSNVNLYFLFFGGAFFGGIFYLLFTFFIDKYGTLVGSSAGIYAILTAACLYTPYYRIHVFRYPISLRNILLILIGINVLFSVLGNNLGGVASHFGGITFGFLFLKFIHKKETFSFFTLSKPKTEMKIVPKYRNQKQLAVIPKSDKEIQLDEILDKISSSGYDSLSKEEVEILKNFSE